jgi:hypothetical protein
VSSKTINFPYILSGQTGFYAKVLQVSTGYFLDNIDGVFKLLPIQLNIPLIELGSTSVYYFSENRVTWSDGEYQSFAYTLTSIFSVARIYVYNNEEVSYTGIQSDLKRTLGLLHENIFIDLPVYDEHNNLVSARVRIYSNPVSVGTGSNVIGTYEITSETIGPGKFTTWKQVS